jgi:hypothetical protein
MKRFQFSIRDMLIAIAFLALAAGWWIDHQRINHIAVQKWEYMTINPFGPRTDSELNKHAAEGWEVCESASANSGILYVLRRPVK